MIIPCTSGVQVETAEKLQAVESQIKSAVKQLRSDREKLYKRRCVWGIAQAPPNCQLQLQLN